MRSLMYFVEQHICSPLHSESNPCFLTWMQVIPCAVLALFIHPSTSHHFLNRIFWAFCVYLEAVSVLPQLRVMQNTKVPSFFFVFKDFYEPIFLLCFNMNRYTAFLYNFSIPRLSDCWTIHCSLCICFGCGKVPELCSLGSPGLILQIWIYMFWVGFIICLCHFGNGVCSIRCFYVWFDVILGSV